MRKVLFVSLLTATLYACHKDAEHPASDASAVEIAEVAALADDATAVDAADAVSAADIASPVTP